jgi:hypothetical protein
VSFPVLATPAAVLLSDWRASELAALFATLPPGPSPSGHVRGRLLAITGLQRLPRALNRGLYAVLASVVNPWRGKSFNGSRGSNHWFWLRGPALGHYHISQQPGSDGGASWWLTYDTPDNPALLRPIRGEARQLQPGRWLCRMLWQGRGQPVTLLWFTLEEQPS